MIIFCPACKKQKKHTNTPVLIPASELKGCVADVSGHCPIVDFKHLADNGIIGIYIKATEGTAGQGSENKLYKRQYTAAKEAGLKIGAFHYLKATSPVTTQFEHFKSIAPKEKMDLIPMLDIEDNFYKYWKTRNATQDSIAKFIQLCKEYYGKAPIIYGTQSSYNTYCAPQFNNYHLMIAKYGKGGLPESKEPEITGNGTFTLWQFTDKYQTGKGHSTIDISRFNNAYSIKDISLY